MISYGEATLRVAGIALPLGSERVAIGQGSDRVLAEPVKARSDSPPADASAMDGYAVKEADLCGPLRIVGQSFAGGAFEGPVGAGECVRIFTGAPVPAGADRVVMQENVERSGEVAKVVAPIGGARHIRRRGSDFRAGQTLLQAGERLGPRALVAAASADWAEVVVWRRPRVIVIATGDELASPGEAHLRVGRIPESVSFGVAALAREWGAEVLETHRLGDDLGALEQGAGEALERADLVIVTGGASVGERDFAKTMFAPFGLETIFSKVAMKPGKPVWLGRARGRLVMGLPGNPTSAMVTARLLLAPLVAGLSGRDGALEWTSLPLAGPLPACGDRETFVRARRTREGAAPIGQQDSGAQAALANADLLLRSRPHDPAGAVGEIVEALAF